MKELPIRVVRDRLWAYLLRRDILRGVYFYSPVEWKAKGEDMAVGASLHIVMDSSPLMGIANSLDEDLNGFLEAMGWYYELGFEWSMHLYPLSVHACAKDN